MAQQGLHADAFPALTEAQIAKLGQCTHAVLKKYRAGEYLFRAGERDFKFFVVKSGEVEILDESGETPRTIVVHRAGQFTGDVSQLTGRPAIVSAVARVDSEVYEVSPDALRQILSLHADLGDIILQAFMARRQMLLESEGFSGIRVIGSRYSRDTFRIRDFLAKNRIPFTWFDLETDPQVNSLLQRFGVSEADTPILILPTRQLLRNPSNRQLAEAIGIRQPLKDTVYDLVIVGAGPAGLAAAVYAASEGLHTIVLERTAPGGQAGTSSRIENYLGFPVGVSGGELAERAVIQASKFGARLPIPTPVTALSFHGGYPVLHLEGGETVTARCLLIATGADYRRLTVEGCDRFEGSGVFYAATYAEAQLCAGKEVVIVGGGNSAGQAAVFLAGAARKVLLVVRGSDLRENMSSYLVQRIEQTPNLEVHLQSEVKRISGNGHLDTVVIVNNRTGEERIVKTGALFSFIGAVPRTDWVPPEIEKDDRQFIKAGSDLTPSPSWSARRQPYMLETSRPGVFVAGDVRSGSVKRVASAVGEGAMAVQFIHQYLGHRDAGFYEPAFAQ